MRTGTFVHSIAVGDDIGHDTLGGYIGNVNEQVPTLLCLRSLCAQAGHHCRNKNNTCFCRWQQSAIIWLESLN